MLKQALFFGVIVLLIGGGVGLSKLKKVEKTVDLLATTTPATLTSTTTILITSSGFSPKDITVLKGSTVVFKNTDTKEHWPASDPHPNHTVYPEFDSKKSILPDQSWSFVFDKVGNWKYHDHKFALRRGVVSVIASESEAKTVTISDEQLDKKTETNKVSTECLKNSVDFSCYENYYENLVAKKGLKVAFTDLKDRYKESAYVRSQCHPLTHVLGHAAVKLYPKVSSAYIYGDPFCWSGYYHGVMEGIVEKIGKASIIDNLSTICDGIPGKSTYSFDYYNCVHGLGHGLMALSSNELFDSLKTCDNLVGSWEQQSCYGGVFMENVIVDNKNHFTKYLKPTEPLYPCSAVDTKYKSPCYLMQTSYMLKITNGDFKRVFEFCSTAEEGFRTQCYQSLGRDASGRSISNAEITKATCELGSNFEQKSNCIIGAVKDFISYYHSDVEAKKFCNLLSTQLTEICLNVTASYYLTL